MKYKVSTPKGNVFPEAESEKEAIEKAVHVHYGKLAEFQELSVQDMGAKSARYTGVVTLHKRIGKADPEQVNVSLIVIIKL